MSSNNAKGSVKAFALNDKDSYLYHVYIALEVINHLNTIQIS